MWGTVQERREETDSYSTSAMCVCVLYRAQDAVETGRLFLNHLSLLGIETVKVTIPVYNVVYIDIMAFGVLHVLNSSC